MIFDRRLIKEAAILVGLSVIIGLAVNITLIRRYLRGDLDRRFISEKEYPGIVLITLAEAEDLFADGKAFFVDARPRQEFRAGHIPGALNWPFEKADEEIKPLTALIPADKTLVIYCGGGDCLASLNLAKLLSAQGIREMRIFLGGWAEWSKGGLPGEQENDQK